MLTKRVTALLFEAYRRNEMCDSYEKARPLTQRWLGLGTEAAYRPMLATGLMRFHDGENPPRRCMGWLCLTDAGARAMKEQSRRFQHALADLKNDTD